MATQTITSGFTGLPGDSTGTFVDVLRGNSALAQMTTATGGQFLQADFRDHKIPVVTRTTLPKKYAEGATRTSADSTTTTVGLNVAVYEDWNPISVEFEKTTDPAGLVNSVVDASAALFPLVFDIEYLSELAGAAATDVEFVAASPIASISSLLATYDATSYGPAGVILTRQGYRKLAYAIGEGSSAALTLGNNGPGLGAMFGDLPMAVTNATGTQLGTASLMAIVGPFNAGVWAANQGMTSERRPDATVDSQGPGTGMVQYLNRAAMGYANGIDSTSTGTGFACLIDAA